MIEALTLAILAIQTRLKQSPYGVLRQALGRCRFSIGNVTEIQSAAKVGALQNLQVAAPFPLTYNLAAVSFPEREKK
jgi:hypothetical protein